MGQRTYQDPILELANRTDLGSVLDLAPTEEEARTVLEAEDEFEAEERAASIAGNLRRMGHAL